MRLAAVWLLALLAFAQVFPVQATRLPEDLNHSVLNHFPDGRIRLDGSIETRGGELFLPLLPSGPVSKRRGKPVIEAVFPTQGNPDVIYYGNGWCYLRVLKKGVAKTVILPGALPDKLKKQLLSCKFPTDLIVPDNFYLPQSLKPLISDNAIQTAHDLTIADAEFGRARKSGLPTSASGPGLLFLTSLNSGKISLVDEQNLSKLADFPTEGTPCGMVCVDGKLYIADQAKNRVLLLDPVRRQFLGQIDLPFRSAPKGLAALPSGKWIYVSESGSGTIAIIETDSRKVLLRTKVAPGPGPLAITPNGNFLLVLNVTSGKVTIISTLNQRVMATVPVGSVPTAVAISKDSQLAYISNRMSNSVSIIDLAARQITATIPTGAGPTGIALSPDNTKLYVANARDNSIGVYDTKTREKLQDIKLPMEIEFPGAISLMRDGKHLLVSSQASDTIGRLNLSSSQFDKQCVLGHSSHDIIWVPAN